MVWTLALYLFQEDTTAAAPAAANGSALLEMIHNSGPVAFAVLVILLLASIFSWAIMISKWSRFGRAHTQSLRFLRAFRKSTRLSEIAAVAEQFKPSPLVAVFSEIHDEYQRQNNGRGLPRNPVALEHAHWSSGRHRNLNPALPWNRTAPRADVGAGRTPIPQIPARLIAAPGAQPHALGALCSLGRGRSIGRYICHTRLPN